MTSKDIKPVIEQPDTGIPLMLSQAIIVAGVLAVGELACSPLYFSLLKASLALIPWAMEAVFMAVAFTFVVGFALLWCAESFTLKMRERFRPFAYAIVRGACWCSPPPSIPCLPWWGRGCSPMARLVRLR